MTDNKYQEKNTNHHNSQGIESVVPITSDVTYIQRKSHFEQEMPEEAVVGRANRIEVAQRVDAVEDLTSIDENENEFHIGRLKSDETLAYQREINYVINEGVFLNSFIQRCSLRGEGDMDDRKMNTILLKGKKEFPGLSTHLLKTIFNSAYIPEENPVQKAFEGYSQEESTDLLNRFLASLHFEADVDREFMVGLITKWLMQIPAMALDNVVPRLVWVLIGPSHIGKTTLLRQLLPDELKEYYAESELNREKDSNILLSENLMVNVDEFGGLAKLRPELFKYIVSALEFKERRAYGTYNQRFVRRAVLCGTSNTIEVIADHSAQNSRIIPCLLTGLDHELFNSIDKRHLMGEVTRLYQEIGPESIRLSRDELQRLGEYSKAFKMYSPEYGLINEFLSSGGEFASTKQILDYLDTQVGKRITPKALGLVLQELGIESYRKRTEKGQMRGYFVNFLK